MPNVEKVKTQVEMSRNGPVATLTFKNPTGVNILSSSSLGELGEQVRHLAEEAHLRYVVFRGQGKTFLAGADIEEMVRFDEPRGEAYSRHGHSVFDLIENLPQVTIAAINGHAMGGGCELSMACDFRLMARSAKIGQPESKLGLIPGWGATVRLPRLVGLARARRIMFSGEALSADDAMRIGLVDDVVDSPEQIDAALARWFELLTHGSPAAITRIKRALRSGDEVHQFGLCFCCSDAQEGLRGFLEKKPTSWSAKA